MKRLNKKNAFTLVELIIVITILAILATIGFMSFQSYTNDARDGKRKRDLASIRSGLEMYQAKKAILPMPDNYATLSSGTTIGYQGYAGTSILSLIRAGDSFQDPSDKSYYTYGIDTNKTKYQLLSMLENNPNVTSYNKNIINETYALDYTNRYSYTLGGNIGIYLSGTTKTPVQEGNSGGTVSVNTANISVVTISVSGGSGAGGTNPVDGICGSSNSQTLASAPTNNLCTAGNSSVVSGTGPWTWTCNGSNGGSNASCSANKIVTYSTGQVLTGSIVYAGYNQTTGFKYMVNYKNTSSDSYNNLKNNSVCENLVQGGYDDWYLPTDIELLWFLSIDGTSSGTGPIGFTSRNGYWGTKSSCSGGARIEFLGYSRSGQCNDANWSSTSYTCVRKY